jgi:hypothetical protein
LNILPPAEPVPVPSTVMAKVTIGRRRYEGSAWAEPGGGDLLLWHMTYRTLEDGRVLDELQTTHRWWVLSEQRLVDELAVHELAIEQTGPAEAGLYLIR